MTYRAAVVGCGRIGCGFDDDPKRAQGNTHAGAYVQTPGVELAALADLDPAKLGRYGRKYGVKATYTDYRAMLAREALDIVSVCTATESHREVVRQAVEGGAKAVFCEKPIADSLAAADEMTWLCADRGVLLLVNHKRRFSRLHQAIADFLRRRRLGEIQQVNVIYVSGLANTGTHVFDLLRLYFGEVAWVAGIRSRRPSPNPHDPNVDGWLWFEQGFPATLQACDTASYYALEIDILGTQGRFRLNSGTHDRLEYQIPAPSPYASEYNDLTPAASPFDGLETGLAPLLAGVRHLVECLDRKGVPACGGSDGFKALEIICALRESAARDGARVTLPLASGAFAVASR